MIKNWRCLWVKLEDTKFTQTWYCPEEIKFPVTSGNPDKKYTVLSNLDNDDQILIQNISENGKTWETAELLKTYYGTDEEGK